MLTKMRWKRGLGVIAGRGWLLMVAVVGISAQTADSTAAVPDGEVLRQIEDPSTGALWLLVRDPSHPAGPGRLVLARQQMKTTQRAISGGAVQPLSAAVRPVIHTGDVLTVEEHTGVVDARLEALALEPAVMGAHFKARLKIGGKVVRAVAVSQGRASFAPEDEVRP